MSLKLFVQSLSFIIIIIIIFCMFRCVCQVHVGSVRQTATILSMSKDHLRTGDKAVVRFRFIKNPEYLRPDVRLVFREGRTKAVGTVTHVIPHVGVVAGGSRQARSNVSATKREPGQGSGLGAVGGQHPPSRPQNEPQKPSKRNRRGRGQKGEPGIAVGGATGAVGGAKSGAAAGTLRTNNPVFDSSSATDLAKRKETVPET